MPGATRRLQRVLSPGMQTEVTRGGRSMRDLRAARRSADVSKRKRRRGLAVRRVRAERMLERRSAFNQSGRGSSYARLETCPPLPDPEFLPARSGGSGGECLREGWRQARVVDGRRQSSKDSTRSGATSVLARRIAPGPCGRSDPEAWSLRPTQHVAVR